MAEHWDTQDSSHVLFEWHVPGYLSIKHIGTDVAVKQVEINDFDDAAGFLLDNCAVLGWSWPYDEEEEELGRFLSVYRRGGLWPTTTSNLVIPRCRLSTYGTRAFNVAGPVCWNSLPDYLKSSAAFHLIVLDSS